MVDFWSYLVMAFGYIALPVLVLGIAWRIWNYKRYPAGFSWGIYPLAERPTPATFLWRVFAWPTLFKGDRLLWIAAMLFHLALIVLAVGHLGVFVDMIGFSDKLGISKDATYGIGITAGSIALVALLFFIGRRVWLDRARSMSTPTDYFWLVFLLAVLAIGVYARVADEASSEAVRWWARALWSFNPEMPPENTWFLIHTFLAEVFIIYSVLGKPVHLVGQFFTQHILVYERR